MSKKKFELQNVFPQPAHNFSLQGPLQGCSGPPTGGLGGSALPHASNRTRCSPSGNVGWKAGSLLVTSLMVPLWRHLTLATESSREDLGKVLA